MNRAIAALGALLALSATGATRTTLPDGNAGIAFSHTASADVYAGIQHDNLWITTTHGRVRVLFRNRRVSATHASWAPSGRALVFDSYCGNKYSLSCSSVWRVNADGHGLQTLSTGETQDYCPAWSPSGGRIALRAFFAGSRNLDSGIYVMDDHGGTRIAVDKNELDGCPAWSPDGSLIVFSRSTGLFVAGLDGAVAREVTATAGSRDAEPQGSPDGTRIAFTRQDANGSRIYVMHTDGSGLRPLARGASPAWSPDELKHAVTRAGEIYEIGANGGHTSSATRARMHSAAHLAWRPAGSRFLG